jgi:hypothetical protein
MEKRLDWAVNSASWACIDITALRSSAVKLRLSNQSPGALKNKPIGTIRM